MRILYLILKTSLNYAARIFFHRIVKVNAPKESFGRTIYVSNHAASFMDPITIASLSRPIVFFMTRSDIFTPVMKPILWACHMLPIYRQHDGEDTKKKNEEVFQKCSTILNYGRNLLIFGEGFTDDIFIRRLKPVKKGAARIGFQTLENLNWEKEIYICPIGVNYSEPNLLGSDYLLAYQEKICLNDYRDLYESNPNKAINDITKVVEQGMQESITHVEDKNLAPFHENIMILTRKGMNAISFDKHYSLIERWTYSKNLAKWLNRQEIKGESELEALKTDLELYQIDLKEKNISDNLLNWKIKSKSKTKELLSLILLIPFMPIGLIHCFIPYYLVKNFTEKSFKRKVFWGSVKLVGGMILTGLINIPVIFLFYHFIYPSYWLGFAYYLTIGLTGHAAYSWFKNLKSLSQKNKILKQNTTDLENKRKHLLERIYKLVPVA